MTNTAERNTQNRNVRTRIKRAWQSHPSAWWYRLIARAAAGHFGALVISGFPEAGIEEVRDQQVAGIGSFLIHVFAPLVVAISVAVYSYRTMDDPEPPERPISRKAWDDIAGNRAFPVALGIFYAAWWPSWLIIGIAVGLLVAVANHLLALPTIPVPDFVGGIVILALTLPLPYRVAKHEFSERYDQEIAALEAATPPGLRFAIDLHRRAEMFHAHAQALEDAMEQAAAISEQVQNEMRLEQQQLGQLHEEVLDKARLNELTPEQTRALAHMLDEQHLRGERRTKKSNFWSNLFGS
jgi:hypothetical protein